MSEVNLPVPFRSQWDADASDSRDDCGSASIGMILEFYGKKLTTNEIQQLSGAAVDQPVTIDQMTRVISRLGFQCSYQVGVSVDAVKSLLNKGLPVILLVHYGDLASRQDQNYKGGHFMDLVGYREDGSYYVDDPNFWGQFRNDGDHHVYTKVELEKAWSNNTQDGNNPNNALILIYPNSNSPVSVDTTSIVTVTPDIGVRVRTTANINAQNIKRSLVKGTKVKVDGFVHGDNYQGNDLWWKLFNEDAYIWSGATDNVPNQGTAIPVSSTKPAPTPQPQPTVNPVPSTPAGAKYTEDQYQAVVSKYAAAEEIILSFYGLGKGAVQNLGIDTSKVDSADKVSIWSKILSYFGL